MTKQQENWAFAKMLKEFPKAFGRVSFRERLMLRTAFTYVLEARYEDRGSIVRQLGERCNQLLKDKGDLIDNIAELEKQIADIKANCDYILEGKDLEIKELKMTDEYIIKTLESKVEKLQKDLRNKRISIKNKKAEIQQLKQQIEKMKCCYNCSKWNDGQCENIKDGYFFHCADFGCDKWEIREND